MYLRLHGVRRGVPVATGIVTMLSVGVLLVWDVFPGAFPAKAHDVLGSLPLALIAVAYLLYQAAHRPPIRELIKAGMLALAFLLWAANQLWPDSPQATLYNDLAIALFVLDVFLVMIGWPSTAPDESFAEAWVGETSAVSEGAGKP